MIHQFTARVADPEAGLATTEFCDRLYGRAADATCSTRGGVVRVSFDRDAESLETAVRSAIADVVAAGGTVASVEIEQQEIGQWLAQ